MKHQLLLVWLCAFLSGSAVAQPTQKPPLHGKHWMAITGKPLAATAGALIFERGGNAVDAACSMFAATCTTWDVLSIHQASNGYLAIRKGPWKLIDGLGSGGFSEPQREEPVAGGPAGQLYNLEKDPQETTNRYQQFPDKVKELHALLDEIKGMHKTH